MIVRMPTILHTNTKVAIAIYYCLCLLCLHYAYFCVRAKKQSMEWEKSESEKSNNISLQLALLQKRQSINSESESEVWSRVDHIICGILYSFKIYSKSKISIFFSKGVGIGFDFLRIFFVSFRDTVWLGLLHW